MLASAAALALSSFPASALAQTTTAPADPATQIDQLKSSQEATAEASARQNGDVTEVESLVITGSRIRRSEFTSPAPIQVITREQATLEGLTDTAELLQTTSVASGSQQINDQMGAYVVPGGGGIESLSLRGLGAQRTLILLNGRRVGPAGVGGQVGAFDLNVIPQSAIERVDILKNGASSIYGSDAVAGVVNIITRNADGGDIDISYNKPFKSGGEELRVSGSWGKTFERGHISISGDYWKEYELSQGQRDYTACSNDYYHDAATGALVDIKSRRTGKPFCYENAITNAVYLRDFAFYEQYDPTNANGPYDPWTGFLTDFGYVGPGWHAAAVGDSWADIINSLGYGSDAYNYSTYQYFNTDERIDAGNSVISPDERFTVYGTGTFQLTPAIELYSELLLNRRNSQQHAVRGLSAEILTGTYDNPFNYLTSARPIVDNVPFNFEQRVDFTRILAGARGEIGFAPFGSGWNWDVYATQSRSRAKYSNDAVLDDAMWALGDSESTMALNGGGPNLGGCATVPVTPVSGRTCVPIDWFDPNTMANGLTDAQQNFLMYKAKGTTDYTQSIVEASVSGDLFTLPAGKVGAAFGVHWRREELDDTPDPFAVNQNLWGQTTAGRTAGSDSVKEVFAEVQAPLFKDRSFAKEMNFSASGRWSDYASYGQSSTYKLGLDWALIPQIRLRGTYGTSFRAPALYEMYLASLTGFQSQNNVDPCIRYEDSDDEQVKTNCAAAGIEEGYIGVGSSATVTQGGGGKGFLDPETSLDKSIGIVWTPGFADLSVAIDYFEIKVDNEITQFGAGNIVNLCYALPNYPNNFCDLFVRDNDPSSPTFHTIKSIKDNYVNVAQQENRGVDLTTRYRHSFPFADMTIDTQFTWQLEDTIDYSGLASVDANLISGEPAFTGKATVRFDRGDWTAFWGIDTIGHQFPSDAVTGGSSRFPNAVLFKRWRESTTYHSLSLRRKLDTWTVVGGVQNVFDEHPPAQSFGEFRVGTAALNNYDMRGRRAFLNVIKTFP